MTDEMDEIWALYADDGAQALDAMETTLTELEDAPEESKAQIGALFRAVHTFKGNSRVLGLANVERVAHLAEDLIGLVRDEGVPLSTDIVDLLIRTSDTLRGMLEETADTQADVAPEPSEGLKTDLQALIDRLTGKAPEPAAAPPEEPVGEPQAQTPQAESAEQADPTPSETPPEAAPDTTANTGDATPRDSESPAQEDAPVADAPAAPTDDPAPDTDTDSLSETPAEEAPQAAEAPAFDPAFAGLLDQLDGGSGFDFDAFEDDSEETDAPEPPNEVSEAAPYPAPVETVAEITEGQLQTIDPMYQKIFGDMATETITEIADQLSAWSEAESPAAVRRVADGLCYAARQMSLSDWVAALTPYLDQDTTTNAEAEALLTDLRALVQYDTPEDADQAPTGITEATGTGKADISALFAALAEFYPQIAEQGMAMRGDTPPGAESRRDLSNRLDALIAPYGFVRLLDAIESLATAPTVNAYQTAELSFYEELLGVERTVPADIFSQDLIAPSQILGAWCLDHVFETLQSLRTGFEDRRRTGKDWFVDFETLMRQVHHACLNFKIDTASQLTMSLIDLFSRTRLDNKAPDIILLQMGRGFVDTMELVFDALDQGDTPDTARLEEMFEEASNACFFASGVVTAKGIETRLGLPPEFHRVMSPESVKTAHTAIEDGLHFYVLRADLNDDDAMAQGFFEWITSDMARMVTNVTVFLDDATMFDFLVASSLEEDGIMERLALLDPSGQKLSMIKALMVHAAPEVDGTEETTDEEETELGFSGDTTDSLALLEAVGAISASHALVDHELKRLSSLDIARDIFAALREAGVAPLDDRLSGLLRAQLDGYAAQIQEISEASAQLASELSHLQQQSMDQRSRPAEVLLGPLKAYASTKARKHGHEASVTYVGGEVILDQHLIEELRDLLKAIVAARLTALHAATRFHVSIETESDHVRLEVTDNSPTPADDDPAIGRLSADIERRKGNLRAVTLPAGAGTRFHLRVPQKLIVLDGMVVRVGRIRYVLPIDAIQRILESDRLLPVAAGTKSHMLNLGEEGLIPVHPLAAWSPPAKGASHLYVVVASNGQRVAIPVDELLGQQLVKLLQLQGVLASVKDMSGLAVLSGGDVGMVVAVSAIASAALAA